MSRILPILLFTCFLGVSLISKAQTKNPVILKARNVDTATKARNPNIKTDNPLTDVEIKKPDLVRGGGCSIDFSNSTGYYIKIYVDGNYQCTLDPYESVTLRTRKNYITIYCITVGETYDWTAAGNCCQDWTYVLN
jgi:hypothetical protein